MALHGTLKCFICALRVWFNPDCVVYTEEQRKAKLGWGHFTESR